MKIKQHSAKWRSTKLRKRNPPPPFFKELANLLDKKVTVQFGSENGVFAITGILQTFGTIYRVEFDDKNSLLQSEIVFDWNFVQNIINNTIILYSIPSEQKVYTNQIINPHIFVGKNVSVYINVMYWANKGIIITRIPYVRGKLKYNSRDKLFYISKLHHMFLSFNRSAINQILDYGAGWPQIDIQI